MLPDAGNTVTLAHYLELLGGAGMVAGLAKYSGAAVRRRGSSPKLLALNTALVTATRRLGFERARTDAAFWQRLVETAVGAHLWAHADPTDLTYWREGNAEVDYVVAPGSLIRSRDEPTAVVVRGGSQADGSGAWARTYDARTLLVGRGGVELEEFLASDAQTFLDG